MSSYQTILLFLLVPVKELLSSVETKVQVIIQKWITDIFLLGWMKSKSGFLAFSHLGKSSGIYTVLTFPCCASLVIKIRKLSEMIEVEKPLLLNISQLTRDPIYAHLFAINAFHVQPPVEWVTHL